MVVSCLAIQFILVAICISLAVPAGIFVPSFVIGACGGRLIGEIMALLYPQGLRGPDGPQIFPGLYAVVGPFSLFQSENTFLFVYLSAFFLLNFFLLLIVCF